MCIFLANEAWLEVMRGDEGGEGQMAKNFQWL